MAAMLQWYSAQIMQRRCQDVNEELAFFRTATGSFLQQWSRGVLGLRRLPLLLNLERRTISGQCTSQWKLCWWGWQLVVFHLSERCKWFRTTPREWAISINWYPLQLTIFNCAVAESLDIFCVMWGETLASGNTVPLGHCWKSDEFSCFGIGLCKSCHTEFPVSWLGDHWSVSLASLLRVTPHQITRPPRSHLAVQDINATVHISSM